MTSLLTLAPGKGSVGDARRWLTDLLDPDHAESQIEQDAVLVLSELVTNSFRHAHGSVACQAAVSPRTIEIAVIDADPRVPVAQPRDPAREGGFGLTIVAGLSSQWGVAEFAGGKAVWARFVATRPDPRWEPVDRVEANGGNRHGEHDADPPDSRSTRRGIGNGRSSREARLVAPVTGYALSVDRTALLAEEAGLRHVDRNEPGLARRRRGGGFVYLDERGAKVSRDTAAWITSLAIPPAWRDVWISTDRTGHLLATGVDDAGRVQYLYHPDYRSAADELKFARLALLGARLPRLRRHLATCIRSRDEHTRATAHLAHLIDVTLMRVGSPDAARSASTYGASTLRTRHVSLHGGIATFEFPGKGGIEQRIDCDDRVIVRYVKQSRRRRGAPLFATSDGWSPTRRDVAAMLSAASGLDVTAKDLRTWGATAHMVRVLCDGSAEGILDAYDAVAQRLGNTRAVCRASYVAPAVVEAWTTDALVEAWASSRTTRWLRREERAARAVLGLR